MMKKTIFSLCVWTMCIQCASASISPFEIPVNESQIKSLHQRLETTIWPTILKDVSDNDWSSGVPSSVLQGLVKYLKEDYNFSMQVNALNQFPHFMTSMGDLNIHFMHQKSSHAHAMPLMLVHGENMIYTNHAQHICKYIFG